MTGVIVSADATQLLRLITAPGYASLVSHELAKESLELMERCIALATQSVRERIVRLLQQMTRDVAYPVQLPHGNC